MEENNSNEKKKPIQEIRMDSSGNISNLASMADEAKNSQNQKPIAPQQTSQTPTQNKGVSEPSVPKPETPVQNVPQENAQQPVQERPAPSTKQTPQPSVPIQKKQESFAQPAPEPRMPQEPTIVGVQRPEESKVNIETNNPQPNPNQKSTQPEIKPVEPLVLENSLPRKDVQEENPKKIDYDKKRVATGITGFDELIGGGFEEGSTVLVVGAVGTGKTMIALQFLYKGIVENDEPGMFISFEEERESLYKHAKQFGWDFEKLENEGKFRLLEFKPHQMTKILEEGGGSVRDMLTEINAKRVVVDSITAYGLLFHDEYTRRDKVLEFLNSLKKWDVTSIVVSEEAPEKIEETTGSIGFITDAIISLYYQHDEEKGIRIHSLEVIKMRGSEHTNKLCAMNFEKNGIRVYPDIEVF